MRANAVSSSIACLIIVISLGCGGSVDDTGSGGTGGQIVVPPVPEAEFPSRLASGFCDNIAQCCQSQGWAYDVTLCRQVYEQFVREEIVAPAKEANLPYDADAARACVQLGVEVAQECAASPARLDNDICLRVYRGSKQVGEPCETVLQCARPTNGDGYCDEVCKVNVRGVLGSPCAWTCTDFHSHTECGGYGSTGDAECFTNDGLYCAPDVGICVQLVASGSPCEYTDACVESDFCDTVSRTCRPRLPTGASCMEHRECDSTTYCAASVCVARKPLGSPCSAEDECASDACVGDQCVDAGLVVNQALCAGLGA